MFGRSLSPNLGDQSPPVRNTLDSDAMQASAMHATIEPATREVRRLEEDCAGLLTLRPRSDRGVSSRRLG